MKHQCSNDHTVLCGKIQLNDESNSLYSCTKLYIFSRKKYHLVSRKEKSYLGVKFSDEINFNSAIALNTLKISLELLISSSLLQVDQKCHVKHLNVS